MFVSNFPKFNSFSVFVLFAFSFWNYFPRKQRGVSNGDTARAHTRHAVCRSTPACPGRRRGLASEGEATWCWTWDTASNRERWRLLHKVVGTIGNMTTRGNGDGGAILHLDRDGDTAQEREGRENERYAHPHPQYTGVLGEVGEAETATKSTMMSAR